MVNYGQSRQLNLAEENCPSRANETPLTSAFMLVLCCEFKTPYLDDDTNLNILKKPFLGPFLHSLWQADCKIYFCLSQSHIINPQLFLFYLSVANFFFWQDPYDFK